MALSFWRRTKDALLSPSVYFSRVRQEHSIKDSFAYLLILSVISYAFLLVPYAALAYVGLLELSVLFSTILVVPAFIISVLLQSLFLHVAVMVTCRKPKRWIDSFKLAVFGPGTLSLVGWILAYLSYGSLALTIGVSALSAVSAADVFGLIGFFQNILYVVLGMLLVYSIFYAYYAFVVVVGMHKVHRISLEKAFWTNLIALVFQAIFVAVVYAIFLALLSGFFAA